MAHIRNRALVILAATLAVAGCSRDEEVKAVTADVDRFTKELVQKFKSAPDPSKGVDEAQKYLDENRDAIHKRMESIKDVRAFQISEETKKKMEDGLMADAKAMTDLYAGNIATAVTRPDFQKKIEKLINDYRDLLAK